METCSICVKNFENRKSYLRHRSYCRKAKTRVTTRKKSCTACTKAKTRCDLAYPSCSRCVTKSLACEYELPSQKIHPSTVSFRSDAFSSASDRSVEHSLDRALSARDEIQHIEVPRIAVMEGSDLDEIIFDIPKPFSPRLYEHISSSLNRQFVICTLKSYPRMLLEDGKLPPFIHPYHAFGLDTLDNSADSRKHKLGPLQNCLVILRWNSRVDKDRAKFIWSTTKAELERLASELPECNYRDTVATLQAIAVYFILRISHNDEDVHYADNVDILLIQTMIKVTKKVGHGLHELANVNDHYENGMPAWDEWILHESHRRTITVILLIDLLFDISSFLPSTDCHDSFLKTLSLPCERELWKASTKDAWGKQYATQGAMQQRPTYGELLNYNHQKNGYFDEWLSQVDDFGTLVMAAASIQPLTD